MRKIILSGGPHTGKTTLMSALRQELSADVHFVPEPAELIITEELQKEQDQPGYKGVFPTTRYSDFVGLVVAKSVELENTIPATAHTAVLDRSLIDNVGYARLNRQDLLVPDLLRHIKAAKYTGALLCDFVGTYTQTPVRPESEEFARAIHGHLLEAYAESGIPILHLPATDVPNRAEMAREFIENV